MPDEFLNDWLASLYQQAEQQQLAHIDILLNATDMDYLLNQELVKRKPLPLVSWLFDKTPEAYQAYNGPVLIRLQRTNNDHQQWLAHLLSHVYDEFRIVFILSPWDFIALTQLLRHFTQAQWMQGLYSGLFRYYEPRILPVALDTLNEQQQAQLQQAIISWHFLDRDNLPKQLRGGYKADTPKIPVTPLLLDDEQLPLLFAWQNAESYKSFYDVRPQDYELTSNELLMHYLAKAEWEANKAHIEQLTARDAFVNEWLTTQLIPAQAATEVKDEV